MHINPEDIRRARDKVAELTAVNPMLRPVFDRLAREYEIAKAGHAPVDPVAKIAERRRRTRALI